MINLLCSAGLMVIFVWFFFVAAHNWLRAARLAADIDALQLKIVSLAAELDKANALVAQAEEIFKEQLEDAQQGPTHYRYGLSAGWAGAMASGRDYPKLTQGTTMPIYPN